MAIGTPVNTVAGATAAAATQAISIPIVTSGRVILVKAHARRASATLAPDDPTFVDSSGVPLTWTAVFSPIPTQAGANPGTKAQWWWAISDGVAKSVTVGFANASNIFASIEDFSIGAGLNPSFTNQVFGGNTGTGAITATLPVSPSSGINSLSFYGAGGTSSTIATGYTSLTAVASSPYRTGYDITPGTNAVMGSTFPSQLLALVNIVEASTAISGVAAIAEGDDTLAAAGSLAIKGAAANAEDGDTIAATGRVSLAGSLSAVEDGDTLGAASVLAVRGVLAVAEDGDVISAFGTSQLLISGALDVTEDDDAVVAALFRHRVRSTVRPGGTATSANRPTPIAATRPRTPQAVRWRSN